MKCSLILSALFAASAEYKEYPATTCWAGHGGVEIDSDSTAPSGLSVEGCEARCDDDDSCTCVAFRIADGKCWKRSACTISQCGQDSDFNTFVKQAAPPSPTPAPTPTPGPGTGSITVFQWNPHWECFAHSESCKSNAHSALGSTLSQYSVDFANIVELDGYSPPSGYAIGHNVYGGDSTHIIYNSIKWRPLGRQVHGCMFGNDRAYIVWAFQHVGSGQKVIMAGAHYPHPYQGGDGNLRTAVQTVMQSVPDAIGVMFAADTNMDADKSTEAILSGLTGSSYVAAAALLPSCCEDSSYRFKYDRVASTFGSVTSSTLLFDPAPSWVHGISGSGYHGEFHKGVIGVFNTGGLDIVA